MAELQSNTCFDSEQLLQNVSREEVKRLLGEILISFKHELTRDLTTMQDKHNETAERISKLERLVLEDLHQTIDVKDDPSVYGKVQTYMKDICDNVGLPGMRYFAFSTFHRRIWFTIHAAVILLSVIFIADSYQKSQRRPTHIGFKTKLTDLADIPFPAVTVCSPITFDGRYRVHEVVQNCLPCSVESGCYRNSSCSDLELITLYKFTNLCKCPEILLLPERVKVLQKFREKFQVFDNDQYGHIYTLTPTCDPEFMTVEGPSGPIPSCDDTFQLLFLKFIDQPRSCTTFNVLRNEDLHKEGVIPESFDNGKRMTTGPKVQVKWTPDTMIGFSRENGTIPMYNITSMKITLKQRGLCTEQCKRNSLSDIDLEHKISLNFPGEHAHNEKKFFSLPTNKAVKIRVIPKISLAQEELRHISPSERGCEFAHERNLSMFKFYTKVNCDIQCLRDCYMNNCGCTSGSLPRENLSDTICLEYSWCFKFIHRGFSGNCNCNCLPACNYVDYDYMVSIADTEEKEDLTTVVISFQNDKFPARVRYEVENLDFIATLLGTIGTFNGFSLIGVFELMYLLTLQLWWRIRESFR